MKKVKSHLLSILFLLLLFPASIQAELIHELSPELKPLLPRDVSRKWGKKVSLRSQYKSLSRDTKRLAPEYPWILTTDKGEIRLGEGVYLKHIKLLTSLSPGSPIRIRGQWAVLVSREEIENGESFREGELYFKPCLVAENLKLVPPAAPEKKSASLSDRAQLERDIQKVKLKAAREPRRASAARKKLAQLYIQAGQYDKAIYEYRFEMILNPTRSSFYHRRIGDIYKKMGDDDRAQIEYELAHLSQTKSSAALYRQRLEEWEKEGRYDLVLQEYRFLLQTDPGSRAIYLKKIARIYDRQGDREQSRYYYQKLIDFYRNLIEERSHRAFDYHLRIAGIYEEMGELEEAELEYARAGEAPGGEAVEALIKQADFLKSQGELDKALKLYLQAEAMEGADLISLRVKLAGLLGKQGKSEEALAYLEKAAAGGGEEGAKARLKIARILLRANQPEKALASYQQALPDLEITSQARVFERMGEILFDLDRRSESEEAFQTAAQLLKMELGKEAADENLLERLARLSEQAGQPEIAHRYYQELIVVYSDKLTEDPEKISLYHRKLGDLYRDLGRAKEAAAHYRAWGQAEPGNPSSYYRLARLYQKHLPDEKLAQLYREKYRELRKKLKEEKSD